MTRKAIIIGAGHNGLVCAAYLAKAGHEVEVFERAGEVGGAAVTQEFAPGFRVSSGAHLLYQLDEGISADLQLENHGLKLAATNLDTIALGPNGTQVRISANSVSGDDIGEADAEAWPSYRARILRFASIVGGLHAKTPPRLASGEGADNRSLAGIAWNIRRLGRRDMREFLRVAGINIYDVLEEQFGNELLKGALSLDGLLGTHLGPRSNNSVLATLHRMSGSVDGVAGAIGIPLGGMGAVSSALGAAAESLGVTIHTGAAVRRVVLDGERPSGVELENGETHRADIVISGADPKTTLLNLLGARHLDAGMVRRIANIRSRGNAAKLHIALDGAPEFAGVDHEEVGQRLVIAPDMDYVERAFNHVKYGEYSAEPVMEITVPTMHDPDLAPQGKHVLSAIVQYAPYDSRVPEPEAKAAYLERVLKTLERHAPSIRQQARHVELLTPRDLEARFGMNGGHWHHAEYAFDQFLMLRPAAGIAQYATPIDGLYLCGAGCHPGGGVMGHAGRNAARTVLEKEK